MNKISVLLKNIIKIFLFLSSYIPLFMILIFQNVDNRMVAIGYIVLMEISLIVLAIYCYNYASMLKDINITLNNSRNNGFENLAYMSGYVIPLASVNTSIIIDGRINIPNIATLIILFSVLRYLYIKSNLYHINPILNLFYDVDVIITKELGEIILIRDKKDYFEVGDNFNVVHAIENIYFVNKSKRIIKNMIIIAIILGLIFLIYIFKDDINKFLINRGTYCFINIKK